MKNKLLLAAFVLLPFCAQAQEKTERLDSVVVLASRAGLFTPVTYEQLGKQALSSANPFHSVPMALNLLPSVVSYNEGGTGLGNSAMTIRGSKGSQINVTLNGITLNDAESQEVFWVNIPSLTVLVSGIQVQRGLGTSASGAGAFGASINMNTAFVENHPSALVELSGGSFRTALLSTAVSTGLLPGGWYMNLAWNNGSTDGYIDHSQVCSSSLFAVLGRMMGRHSFRVTYLMGNQESGITWDGISLEQYALDRRHNDAGENDTDHYAQHHLQLNYTRLFGERLSWSNTFNYTRGDGYDEYEKKERKLRNYGFPASTVPARSDMRYRKKMDNDLLVFSSNLRYRDERWEVNGGLNLGRYRGGHNGEVLQVKALPSFDKPFWYENTGIKWDMSAILRAEYRLSRLFTAYADLQYRQIHYRLNGVDDDWLEYGAAEADRLQFERRWHFFNPRAGITASWGVHKLYASVAVGHREPGRGDIKENVKGSGMEIRPESMLDAEAGYELSTERFRLQANLYMMEYWDMLLETGRLSSSGYAVKENVPRAWRRGFEYALAWTPWPFLRLEHNGTWSVNQIDSYTAYVPFEDYSDSFPVPYGRTTMLMSPSYIAMWQVRLFPWKGGSLCWNRKFVGKQYLDNSMRASMEVPAYDVDGLSAGQEFPLGKGTFALSLYVNNLFNRMYYAAGWRWESYDPVSGTISSGVGVYPQSPLNFTLKARFTF